MSTIATTTATSVTGPVTEDAVRAARRSGAVAMCVFSTWVVVGLFVDGWAHVQGKPETFFTPWHGLLYSGFMAGIGWAGISDYRLRRQGIRVPVSRLSVAGFAAFAVGGVADMAWHLAFGIEKDVAALVSPSHLLLMGAGLLLVTEPIRVVLALEREANGAAEELTWRTFAPAAIGLTLTVAVISFFGQFASGLLVIGEFIYSSSSETSQVHGIVSILLSTAVLVGALVWATGPWPRPPMGTFTLVFGGVGLLMAGLGGFHEVVLVLPVALGGGLADVLLARQVPIQAVAAAVPAVMWAAWFVTYDVAFGLGWPAELAPGTVVFATLIGYGLALIATSPRPVPA